MAAKLQGQLYKGAMRICAALLQYVAFEDAGARLLERARNLHARTRLFARAAVGDAATADRIMGPLLTLPDAPHVYFNKHLSLLRQHTHSHAKTQASHGSALAAEILSTCDELMNAFDKDSSRLPHESLYVSSAEVPLCCAALHAFASDTARAVALDIAHKGVLMEAVIACPWSEDPFEMVMVKDGVEASGAEALDAAAREWSSMRVALQGKDVRVMNEGAGDDDAAAEETTASLSSAPLMRPCAAAWLIIDDYYARLRDSSLLTDADADDEPISSPSVRASVAAAGR